MFNLCDIVKYGDKTYRVEYFVKKVHWEPRQKTANDVWLDEIIDEIIEYEVLKEWYKQQECNLPHSKRYYYQYCEKEDATHAYLVSSSYATAPIEECIPIGGVDWAPSIIEQHIGSAKRMIEAQRQGMMQKNYRWE